MIPAVTVTQLDCSPNIRTRNITSQKNRKGYIRQIQDPLHKALDMENPYLPSIFLCDQFFGHLFFKTCDNRAPTKYTKQNQIRPVEYSCAKFSGPSGVPRFVRELVFWIFKEVKLVCVFLIIECLPPHYRLVQLAVDRSFNIRANVCDPTKMIVKLSLQTTLICSVVFRGSVKGSQRVGFSIIEFIRSYNEH